jgi:hypothetical protein
MYTTSHELHCGVRRAAVMPLVWVIAACHLAPRFDQFDDIFPFDRHDLLSAGKLFFFNHYSSHFMFGMVNHWRAVQEQIDEAEAAARRAVEEEAARARATRGKVLRARLVQARNNMTAACDQFASRYECPTKHPTLCSNTLYPLVPMSVSACP